MKAPIISRVSRPQRDRPQRQPVQVAPYARRRIGGRRNNERGVTLLLVAVAMLTIIAMAALAIDVVTLYLAREEAQRAADTAALAGARIFSLSGVTGDPDNVQGALPAAPWQTVCTLAQQVATAVAMQNGIDSTSGTATVTMMYNGTAQDCNIGANSPFGLNPQVQVQVVRNGLPTLFSRIWNTPANTVSATSTAEAYNSSDSAAYTSSGDIYPVAPRCVKPWFLANLDPLVANKLLVHQRSGKISSPGILLGSAGTGIIGEQFTLSNACSGANCSGIVGTKAKQTTYVPALISTSTTPTAVPSCSNGSNFQEAIGGCDVATSYACGTQNGAQLDYTINPSADTDTAVNCLTRYGAGQDTINTATFPYQILAGPGNPYASTGQLVTTSTSIVTLPIVDTGNNAANPIWPGTSTNLQPQVNVVGFLQVFIYSQSTNGNMSVTVLNVTGCGNGTDATSTSAAAGSSPVPIRLITPTLPGP